MAIEWMVTQCERVLEHASGHAGVITVLHWQAVDAVTINAGEADEMTHHARVYSRQGLEPVDLVDWTEYEAVTHDQCVAWLKTKIGAEGVAAIEQSVADQLASKVSPTSAHGVPWGSG